MEGGRPTDIVIPCASIDSYSCPYLLFISVLWVQPALEKALYVNREPELVFST